MSTSDTRKDRALPLVRLSALNPFLIELERRKCDTSAMLSDIGLPTDVPVSQELFVALPTMYRLVEQTAEISGDVHFGFNVGATIEVQRWDPFREAAATARTVGDLLTGFVMTSVKHAATRFFLDIGAERTTFRMQRPVEPEGRPEQNDAFYAGMISRILKVSTRRFHHNEVLAKVSAPSAIPSSELVGRVAEQNRQGVSVSFPTQWLRESFQSKTDDARAIGAEALPGDLFQNLWIAWSPHLGDDGLSAEKAARLCGYSRRTLSSLLRERGTTIAREIASMRAHFAVSRLTESNDAIAVIGLEVGYPDPAVFARAFKSWTGTSPSEYRRRHAAAKQQ